MIRDEVKVLAAFSLDFGPIFPPHFLVRATSALLFIKKNVPFFFEKK